MGAPVKASDRITIDRRNAVSSEAFVFAREDWEFAEVDNGAGGTQLAITTTPRPGTWTVPCEGFPSNVKALLCCPKCGNHRIALLDRIHQIDAFGKVSPDFRHQGCDFARPVYLDRWNKKPLYAIVIERTAIERSTGKRIMQKEIHYCHATTAEEALFHLGPGLYRVIGVAPAIGVLAADEHGDKNVADVTQLKSN